MLKNHLDVHHSHPSKWLVTFTPAGSPPKTYSTFILVRLRQDPLRWVPTKQQKRNTFSVLPVNSMTTNDNPQSGIHLWTPASNCNAERQFPSSSQRPSEKRTKPPTTLINDSIYAPHDSMESQDQIRPLPTSSILLRQRSTTTYRHWNLNFHLWTTAGNLTRRK